MTINVKVWDKSVTDDGYVKQKCLCVAAFVFMFFLVKLSSVYLLDWETQQESSERDNDMEEKETESRVKNTKFCQ